MFQYSLLLLFRLLEFSTPPDDTEYVLIILLLIFIFIYVCTCVYIHIHIAKSELKHHKRKLWMMPEEKKVRIVKTLNMNVLKRNIHRYNGQNRL